MSDVPALMVQGTASDAGKSVLVAGLCRAFARRGLSVRPFKPQNMSNNAAATPEGHEIGRAQALQARACGIAPSAHMNPVLLKPEGDARAQLVLQGRVVGSHRAQDYHRLKKELMPAVLESFARVAEGTDLVLCEGAGSPAEVNLREGDIANMGFARAAGVPVVLVGDIERGGVIAQLVGTAMLLEAEERALVRGHIVNKFRGDPRLFDAALGIVEERSGLTSLGVVPWLDSLRHLPKEDTLGLAGLSHGSGRGVRIVVPRLPSIANFDDLDPLSQEPGVDLRIVEAGTALPGDADLVLLPGSKATLRDLACLRQTGWDIDIMAHHRRGGHVLGLCGGYQMLGRTIGDPAGLEGAPGEAPGLGLLDLRTTLLAEKSVRLAQGREVLSGLPVAGYEIHLGRTDGPDAARPLLEVEGRPEGARSADGRVAGCYLHGIFASDGFRSAFLERLRSGAASALAYEARIEATLDELAAHLERHLAMDRLLAIAQSRLQPKAPTIRTTRKASGQ